ncbi:MAG: hypothetical protein MJZ74_08260 [Muribaculaceae bacterium]|nr:hypothetical protein [Muribaculaceae bacterium]
MKKSLLCATIALAMTSCGTLFQRQDGGSTGRPYNNEHNSYGYSTTTPPPGSYNYGQQYNSGHVTQQTGANAPGQHVTQSNNNTQYGNHPQGSQYGGNQYYGDPHNGNQYGGNQYNGNQHHDRDNHNGHANEARRPATGTIVTSLPKNGVKEVTVNGEKLLLYNGTYYKAVRTNSGTGYQVVGTTNR